MDQANAIERALAVVVGTALNVEEVLGAISVLESDQVRLVRAELGKDEHYAGDNLVAFDTLRIQLLMDEDVADPIRVRHFYSTHSACDAASCGEVDVGDILVVPDERVVGLAGVWPLAVSEEIGQMRSVGWVDYESPQEVLSEAGISVAQVKAAMKLSEDYGFGTHAWTVVLEQHPAAVVASRPVMQMGM